VTNDEWTQAADFLEEYAVHAPRPEELHPPADTPQWREVQRRVRDLAARFRRTSGAGTGVKFLEPDARFLEEQSERMYRMHYWLRKKPNLGLHDIRAADAAGISAGRFAAIAEMVRGFIPLP